MNVEKQISVAIADAQSVFRMGLRALFADHSDIDIVGEAGNSKELIPLLKVSSPDILIMDYNPHYFGSEELSRCLAQTPSCKIIIISSQDKKWQIFKSLEFNVYCYLTKECGVNDIHKAIRSTARGEKFFCNFIVDVLLENNLSQYAQKKTESCQVNMLTERELEITRLIASGKKNKDIAEELNLSPHTVHSHRKNILKKVGVSSALELTTYAIKMGILES